MNINKIDFNELYIEQKKLTSFKAKEKEAWDKKAFSMNKRVHNSVYNENFIKQLDLNGIDSILDIGCGVGNLAIKLSSYVKNITCLDYSSSMIKCLEENLKEQNINNIETINKSWDDDWSSLKKADLVIASRSMEVPNLKKALEKLNKKANKKVVISYKNGGSYISSDILKVIDKKIVEKPDYIYVLNVLYQMGITASVNFIKSEGRSSIYDTKEKFINSVLWTIDELSQLEKQKLSEYYDSLKTEDKKQNDEVEWAVISWDKKEDI